MEVFALPISGIVRTDFPFEIGNGWRLKTVFKRPCLQEMLPTATAHAKWGAKICAIFVRAVFVVFG